MPPVATIQMEIVSGFCAEWGHANIARMLVTTSGIDLNQNDSYGRTALSYAKDKRSGHENVASILTMAGAKG